MAAISICEQLKLAAACSAMDVVLHDVGGPIGIEEFFELAGALTQGEGPCLNQSQKAQGELQILPRLVKALSIEEFFTL